MSFNNDSAIFTYKFNIIRVKFSANNDFIDNNT